LSRGKNEEKNHVCRNTSNPCNNRRNLKFAITKWLNKFRKMVWSVSINNSECVNRRITCTEKARLLFFFSLDVLQFTVHTLSMTTLVTFEWFPCLCVFGCNSCNDQHLEYLFPLVLASRGLYCGNRFSNIDSSSCPELILL
jgi:hypothetical protein